MDNFAEGGYVLKKDYIPGISFCSYFRKYEEETKEQYIKRFNLAMLDSHYAELYGVVHPSIDKQIGNCLNKQKQCSARLWIETGAIGEYSKQIRDF